MLGVLSFHRGYPGYIRDHVMGYFRAFLKMRSPSSLFDFSVASHHPRAIRQASRRDLWVPPPKQIGCRFTSDVSFLHFSSFTLGTSQMSLFLPCPCSVHSMALHALWLLLLKLFFPSTMPTVRGEVATKEKLYTLHTTDSSCFVEISLTSSFGDSYEHIITYYEQTKRFQLQLKTKAFSGWQLQKPFIQSVVLIS